MCLRASVTSCCSPVQLVQGRPSGLLSTVAAVHLVLVWTSSRQTLEHVPQRRHLPPGSTVAAVQREGATAFCWETQVQQVQREDRQVPQFVDVCWTRQFPSVSSTSRVVPLLSACSCKSLRPTDSSRDQAKNGTVLFWATSVHRPQTRGSSETLGFHPHILSCSVPACALTPLCSDSFVL